jgi:hypothetical protein
MLKSLPAVLIILFLATAPAMPNSEGPKFRRYPDAVAGQYIVVLQRPAQLPERAAAAAQVSSTQQRLLSSFGGKALDTWYAALWGFSAELTEAQAISLSLDPSVRFVEENARIFVSGTQNTDFSLRNLDRIDQSSKNYDYTYSWECSGSVSVYVVDTGVLQTHAQFGYRVMTGADFAPADGYSQIYPNAPGDDNYLAGHGTSVASVIAGADFGVAKSARIIPVRVINRGGHGTVANLISGLNWIYDDYDLNQKWAGVVNMSIHRRLPNPLLPDFSFTISTADADSIEWAVNALLSLGLPVVASANNQNTDACYTTPARIPGVITVAGSTITWFTGTFVADTWWTSSNPTYDPSNNTDPGSNWGSCVDIIAPASEIRSAHTYSDTSERTSLKTGTSFAAPHVTGAIARYLHSAHKVASWPSIVATWLDNNSHKNVVSGTPSGTPNKLLYVPYACRWNE